MRSWFSKCMQKSLKRTVMLLAILMVVTSVFANMAKPTRLMSEIYPREKLANEIPLLFSRWEKQQTNIAEVVDPTQQAVLKYLYTETLSASYINANKGLVMLSIAYGKDQRDGNDVHQPDLCYPAQGFTVIEQRELPLVLDANRSIVVKYMKTQKGQRIEPLIYWTTLGDAVYRGKLQKKIIDFKYSRDNLIPDGMIVRVSTIEEDSAIAMASITDFVTDWYASMPEQQRKRYFGELNP